LRSWQFGSWQLLGRRQRLGDDAARHFEIGADQDGFLLGADDDA
jgi:hypothetical protein